MHVDLVPYILNEFAMQPIQTLDPESVASDRDTPKRADGYAGDVTPELAWHWVEAGEALLVDVRSNAEREWVGFVANAAVVAWKQWPGMTMNPDFDTEIRVVAEQAGGKPLVLQNCEALLSLVTPAARKAWFRQALCKTWPAKLLLPVVLYSGDLPDEPGGHIVTLEPEDLPPESILDRLSGLA